MNLLQNKKCEKHFYSKKSSFQDFWNKSHTTEFSSKICIEKRIYKKTILKNKFSVDFYFIYFFFSKKLFYFWDIWKSNCRFWSAVTNFLFHFAIRFQLTHQMAGRGGRLAPRLSSVIKKSVYMWVTDTATDCVFWAYLPVVEVRTTPLQKLENYTEKTKKS